jgi:molybdopterin-guanine dinucleotide biosynthesis protein A
MPLPTIAILAGGKGTRLGGVAKGLLVREGRTVIERLLELGPLGAQTLIVSGDPAYDRFGVARVEDVERGRGAPGGLVTALLAAKTEWVLVVACDMPFISLDAARAVIAGADDCDVCCYQRAGELEPMLAVYRSALGPLWRGRLSTNPSLRSLLKTVRVRALEPSDPRVLDSLNTPADLAEGKS